MPTTPFVTIGVPVYHGEQFLEETLRSIQNQSHRDIEVIISIDGAQPLSEERCQPFLKDSRFRLVVHPERMGWVANINWMMRQVQTPYWYCHAQDDLADPSYVEVLLAHAGKNPEAAVVYCDIESFGLQNLRIRQPSVNGNPITRQLKLINRHHSAVAFRGLTRVEALQHAGDIPSNMVESFSTDTVWMSAMARWGGLVRLPVKLYYKRYHPANEHAKWSAWPAEKIINAWVIHCADMLEQAMLVNSTVEQRILLWKAAALRLKSPRFPYIFMARLKSRNYGLLLDGFLEHLHTTKRMNIPELLNDEWENICTWTNSFFNRRRFSIREAYRYLIPMKIEK